MSETCEQERPTEAVAVGGGAIRERLVLPKRPSSREAAKSARTRVDAGEPPKRVESALVAEFAPPTSSEVPRRGTTRKAPVTVVPACTVPREAYATEVPMDTYRVLSRRTNAVEHDRQLIGGYMDLQDTRNKGAVSTIPLLADSTGIADNSSLFAALTDAIGLTETSKESEKYTVERRHLKTLLLENDPMFTSTARTVYRMLVEGCSAIDLRTVTSEPREVIRVLREIGITYDDWSATCGFCVMDLSALGATWTDVVGMGFKAEHIVRDRDRDGPKTLGQTLKLTFQDLHDTIGITVDDAVTRYKFTTADFGMLGESMQTLLNHGLNDAHIGYMHEPPYNFVQALGASESDIRFMFGERAASESEPTLHANMRAMAAVRRADKPSSVGPRPISSQGSKPRGQFTFA
jgi:hypothetical protein